jgi:hypothetical protein
LRKGRKGAANDRQNTTGRDAQEFSAWKFHHLAGSVADPGINENTTGVATSDRKTEMHSAPMTAIASGLSMSAPEPTP